MTKKKLLLLTITSLIAIFGATLASNIYSFTEIITACVDQSDGDVAFATPTNHGISLKVFDKSGELLLSKYLDSEGGRAIYIEYIDSNLCVYTGRTNTVLIYDNNMNYISQQDSPELYNSFLSSFERTYWKGWNTTNGITSFVSNDTTYCYEVSSFWSRIVKKGECKFYIQNEKDEQIVLYHSKSK